MERFAQNIIRKYGSEVFITSGEKTVTAKGILRPLYHSDRNRAFFKRLSSGLFDSRHYLIMLQPDVKLKKTGGEVLECNGVKYSVNSNGTYMIGSKEIYVWAVLTACTDPLEDDYDRSN